MDKKVIFLILHYNSIEVTRECIDSIKELEQQERIEIVIVDNASPNGSGKVLEEEFSQDKNVHVRLNSDNAGFSKGNNFGYEYIKANMNIQYLIVANNDIIFKETDFVDKLDQEYKQSRFDILGPDVWNTCLQVHQNPLDSSVRKKEEVDWTIRFHQIALKYFGILYPLLCIAEKLSAQKRYKQSDKEYRLRQEGICLMGACLIFSEQYVLGKNKIFYPETYFYYEEYILTLQALREKRKIVYSPDIVVDHKEGSATNSISSKNKMKKKFVMKNMLVAAKIYRELL